MIECKHQNSCWKIALFLRRNKKGGLKSEHKMKIMREVNDYWRGKINRGLKPFWCGHFSIP